MILMFKVIFVSVLQRPSDDLMSQSPMVTNGTSPPHLSGSDNDAKKVSTLSISLSAGPGRAVTFSDPPPPVDCAVSVLQVGRVCGAGLGQSWI